MAGCSASSCGTRRRTPSPGAGGRGPSPAPPSRSRTRSPASPRRPRHPTSGRPGGRATTCAMHEPFATTLDALAAGRAAAVSQLRTLADHLERLALHDVAEVLVLLEPTLDALRRQATFALERAPAGAR